MIVSIFNTFDPKRKFFEHERKEFAEMSTAAGHAMKRIPLIKFPQRHLKPSSGTARKAEDLSLDEDVVRRVFSRSPTNLSVGGKASDQPKRTPVSQEEIDAIKLGGCI